MASNINTAGIDADYPVAGVDNDSQGFRDNFDEIKTNLDHAKLEIEDLQDNVARTDVETSFINNTIKDVNIENFTETFTVHNSISEQEELDYALATYHKINVTKDTTLILTNWPERANSIAKMKVVLVGNDEDHTVGTRTAGTGTIKYDGAYLASLDSTGSVDLVINSSLNPVVLEFWAECRENAQPQIVYAQFLGDFV